MRLTGDSHSPVQTEMGPKTYPTITCSCTLRGKSNKVQKVTFQALCLIILSRTPSAQGVGHLLSGGQGVKVPLHLAASNPVPITRPHQRLSSTAFLADSGKANMPLQAHTPTPLFLQSTLGPIYPCYITESPLAMPGRLPY